MNWIELKSKPDLANLISKSFESEQGVVIFKHSTRCSISVLAKSRIERSWDFEKELPIYYLDLLKYRDISNEIENTFNVKHQSPQLLHINNGECVYHASHTSISLDNLKS